MITKIEFKTNSFTVAGIVQPILSKTNIVEHRTAIIYERTIRTRNEKLVEDIVAVLQDHGIDPSEYEITSEPCAAKSNTK